MPYLSALRRRSPTRVRVGLQLRTQGEACVGDLAESIGTSDSAVSHALRLLRASDIVECERRGKQVFYSLIDEHAHVVLDATITHLDVRHR